MPRPLPRRELLDLVLDDLFGATDFGAALLQVLLHDRLQVVDVVEEHLLDLGGVGLDVARHRDVDEKQRPRAAVPAWPPRSCAFVRIGVGEPVTVMTMSDSRSACGSASHGDDDAADLVGQLLRVRQRPAGDDQRGDALRLQVHRGELAHLAGADDEHAAARRLPKIFFARLTAAKLTDTAPSASAVSERTRLPTPNAQ